ncbi:hypothetical protein BDB00DRAFT_799016 [Zychaea mexicana]|uniref:uncharacterized protein n=1 Tax=Zychaea mexicana TaxID=64656 RepID=UPI0022FF32A5|nr:uncharacterized protein BDB00DRAFT_799016 [Zychaea mexicana]KAI9498664.1 hypothetical protein BDB00DRAFT_799016 [Zychaea mexicana]
MPKLRYKDHPESEDKKHKRKKKKHRKRERSRSPSPRRQKRKHRYYEPPKLYEEESGWVPPQHNTQHDEEAEWRERLFSAMADDEGQDPFYSQYENYGTGGSSGAGGDGRSRIDTMNDEEYRDYIATQMYRKKNAEAIAWEKAIAAEAKRKEKKRKEAQARAREEEARIQKERERQETIMRQLKIQESRSKYEEQWKHMEMSTVISKKDIPWPIAPGASFSAQSVKEFLVLAASSLESNKKNVRKEQLRYHPDKFIHRVLRKFEGTEREKKRLSIKTNEISGWLNELWQELNNGSS